jgi:hypothetical protein
MGELGPFSGINLENYEKGNVKDRPEIRNFLSADIDDANENELDQKN